MESSQKIRLDLLLVERHGYESRSRARDAILRGCISVNGEKLSRPSQLLSSETALDIRDPAQKYVSRAALKLIHALDLAKISVSGKIALDLGASTGGFTQVPLERGAKHIYSVDVGSEQMHPSLVNEPRITNIENLNARELISDHLDGCSPQIVVSDLSFISLKIALPPSLALAAPQAEGVFLIKPQFEVGKNGIASGGIVRDRKLIETTVSELTRWLDDQAGWSVTHLSQSPIIGGDGNAEYLMTGRKSGAL